jgi:hypothetical protein
VITPTPTYKYYTPTGGLDMMDLNILDHDAWSKFALGWNRNPMSITSELSFPLTVNSKKAKLQGDCLLIPAAGESYNGSAFDEYMMVELYTPDGLNALDAKPNTLRPINILKASLCLALKSPTSMPELPALPKQIVFDLCPRPHRSNFKTLLSLLRRLLPIIGSPLPTTPNRKREGAIV